MAEFWAFPVSVKRQTERRGRPCRAVLAPQASKGPVTSLASGDFNEFLTIPA